MTVTKDDLEAALADLRRTSDPVAGVFGPSSITWEIGRESIAFLGGARAALLQTAHPFVATGVDQHSATKTDPVGRFLRTFDAVFAMVFGDLDHAFRAARTVHAIHGRITGVLDEDVGAFRRGSRYEANDERALLWVAATLWDTSIQIHELVFGEVATAKKDGYIDESLRFARLFGIPAAMVPRTWSEFRAYFDETVASNEIAVGRAAVEIARFLMMPPRPSLSPVWSLYTTVTAGLLPEKVRRAYGFRFGRLERTLHDAALATLRRSYLAIPARARLLPAYVEASARCGGKRENVLSRAVNRAFAAAAKRSRKASRHAKRSEADDRRDARRKGAADALRKSG